LLTVPLRPDGFKPGRVEGALHLDGRGWSLTVPLGLYVPPGASPWWEAESASLATHIREHALALTATAHGIFPNSELFLAGTPVDTDDPRGDGDRWTWPMTLTAGEYSCTLLVDGKAVPLEAPAPHRWEWEHAGRGRLTVGAAAAEIAVWNIGDEAVELHVEADEPWLAVAPARLRLEPGARAALALHDRLTHLDRGAEEGHVRLFALPDRRVWAELPVSRAISAEQALPVLSPSALELVHAGRRIEPARFTVRNAGGRPMRFSLDAPPHLLADGGVAPTLGPGESTEITLRPIDPNGPATGFINLVTDSGYPALRRLQVPYTVRRLQILADPPEADLGAVAPGGSHYQRIRFRRSDGHSGRFTVAVAPADAHWLDWRNDQLVARNRGPEYGPVATTITVRDAVSGAESAISVKALLQKPRLRYSGPVRLSGVRPDRTVTATVRISDEGQGLQVRDVRSLHHWLTVTRTPDGAALTIRTGRRKQTLVGDFQIYSNDPDSTVVNVPVKVTVQPTWWDRIRLAIKRLFRR
jgi:hypothetical protein